jgi:hypothetical protein
MALWPGRGSHGTVGVCGISLKGIEVRAGMVVMRSVSEVEALRGRHTTPTNHDWYRFSRGKGELIEKQNPDEIGLFGKTFCSELSLQGEANSTPVMSPNLVSRDDSGIQREPTWLSSMS